MKEVSGSFLSNNDKFYEINRLNNSNVDYIHFDVMDGKFVDNKNITISELPKLIDNVKKKIDIHFMVNDPTKYIEKICYYNIEYITIHYEIKNLEDYIDKIKNYGFKVGIAIKPETDIEKIYYLLDKINYNSDNYKYFNDVKINKIVVSEDKNIWNIHLNCLNTIRFDILKQIMDKLSNYVNKKYKYELTIESNDEDLSLFDDYYKNILILILECLLVIDINQVPF